MNTADILAELASNNIRPIDIKQMIVKKRKFDDQATTCFLSRKVPQTSKF